MSEKQVLEKLDNIQRGQKSSSYLTNASLGFALATYMTATIGSATELHMQITEIILGFVGLFWFLWNGAFWLKLYRSK